jgi:transposase
MNNLKKCWAPEGVRPIVPLQRIRQYLYVFSATSPWTGDSFSLIFPLCNTHAMTIFLEQFSAQYRNFLNILIVDRASWHVTKKLPYFDNIRFILLPPGSPELNPTEHLWDHIREKYFANKTYDSIDEVEEKMVEVLKNITHDKETIKSLVGFNWLTECLVDC